MNNLLLNQYHCVINIKISVRWRHLAVGLYMIVNCKNIGRWKSLVNVIWVDRNHKHTAYFDKTFILCIYNIFFVFLVIIFSFFLWPSFNPVLVVVLSYLVFLFLPFFLFLSLSVFLSFSMSFSIFNVFLYFLCLSIFLFLSPSFSFFWFLMILDLSSIG